MECGWPAKLAGLSILSMALVGQAALAQVPGSVGQPLPREAPSDDLTPSAREAEDYTAKGVPIGSFKLFADLEADEQLNDNVYATSAAVGKQAAFIQLIQPSLNLKSDWNNHMLNLFAQGSFGLYTVDPTQNNYQDISAGANGRLDIMQNWNVYGGASWNRLHEVRGTPNTVTSTPGLPVTVFNLTSANAGYFQKFNRLSLRFEGRLDNFSYVDNGLGPAQGVIPNSDRDRNEWRESARVGYELVSGYEVWTRAGFNQRNYFQLDSSGLDRGSHGFDIVGGILVDLTGITSVELFAGYMQQTYNVGSQISTPTFGLTGYWNPTRPLWIKPFVRRVVDDSALTTSVTYISTSLGVDATYDLRPNVQLTGHFDYLIADYAAFANTSTGSEYDQYYTVKVGALYFPTSHFYIGPSYQFVHRSSNQFNSDFDQNLIMLRLGARL